MSLALCGTGISRGIAIGRLHVMRSNAVEADPCPLLEHQLAGEVVRFQQALETAKIKLLAMRDALPATLTPDIAALLDVHQLMLEDEALSEAPIHLIQSHRCNAEWALELQRDVLASRFETITDPYLRSRRQDVDQVIRCIQHILLQQQEPRSEADRIVPGDILLCDDLAPADALLARHQGAAGFILQHGGPTSHTAILIRSLDVPAVIGLTQARAYLGPGETVVVDGTHGMVLSAPDQHVLDFYRQRQKRALERRQQLAKLKSQPAVTRDGVAIALRANIELPSDIAAVKDVAAEGVGLYRTEFLFMNRLQPPDEEEQLMAYREVVETLGGAPVTIRTLDLAADKQADRETGLLAGDNPLGLRGIRLCLKEPALLLCQLRAILRAAASGPVRLLLPMVSTLQEVFQVKRMIAEASFQLRRQGLKHDAAVPLGCMIEVPAAALCADLFACHSDFLSIGTNDLIQYTLAVERTDESVGHLYNPLHPAVLRMLWRTIRAAQRVSCPIALCGEMAANARYTRLLLGMGLREFSVPPSALPEIKQVIRNSHSADLRRRVKRLMSWRDIDKISGVIEELNTTAS